MGSGSGFIDFTIPRVTLSFLSWVRHVLLQHPQGPRENLCHMHFLRKGDLFLQVPGRPYGFLEGLRLHQGTSLNKESVCQTRGQGELLRGENTLGRRGAGWVGPRVWVPLSFSSRQDTGGLVHFQPVMGKSSNSKGKIKQQSLVEPLQGVLVCLLGYDEA